MGSPYLSADESIVLSAHDMVVNAVRAEAILTNQRLMLVDRNRPRLLPQDIPFTAIETVTIAENGENDPVLTLSVVTPDGTRQPVAVTFPEGGRGHRSAERDEWATRIRELSVTSQHEGGVVATELMPPWVPGIIPEENVVTEGEDVVPAGTRFRGPSLSERRSRAQEASARRTIGIVAAALLCIAIIAVIVLFYAPPFSANPAPPATPAPTTVPTPAMTMPPTRTPEQVATTVVAPEPVQPQGIVPQTGVWLHVAYDGSYTGFAGAAGRYRDIEGTGDRYFQIPAKNELVTAAITKGDNSGNPLTVEFYNEGEMVKASTMTKPGGTLSLDVILTPEAVPVPTE